MSGFRAIPNAAHLKREDKLKPIHDRPFVMIL